MRQKVQLALFLSSFFLSFFDGVFTFEIDPDTNNKLNTF